MCSFRPVVVGGSLILSLVVLGSTTASCPAASRDASTAKPAAAGGSKDLRPLLVRHGLKTRLQGKRGTCSVFTMAGALEYALAKKNGKCDFPVSVEFLNWASNEENGIPEDGSYFADLWQGVKAHGACSEADLPYRQEFDPQTRPSDDARAKAKPLRDAGLHMHWIKYWNPNRGLTDRQLQDIKRALDLGWPVCGGFLWPKDGREKWNDGVLEMRSRDQVRDGHSVLLVGYRDDLTQPGGGVFLIRNSAGRSRDGALSYEYVKAYMNDAVWIDDVARPEDPSARELAPSREKPWWVQ